MLRPAMTTIILLAMAAPPTQARGADAQALAQEILDAGAKLFDAKDAKAMAATYAGDAVLFFESRDSAIGAYKVEEHRGRAEVEEFYRKYFEGQPGAIRSKNTVEFARRLAPDLLTIQGVFQPDAGADPIAFVQVRVREGDRWAIRSLRLFYLPKT